MKDYAFRIPKRDRWLSFGIGKTFQLKSNPQSIRPVQLPSGKSRKSRHMTRLLSFRRILSVVTFLNIVSLRRPYKIKASSSFSSERFRDYKLKFSFQCSAAGFDIWQINRVYSLVLRTSARIFQPVVGKKRI